MDNFEFLGLIYSCASIKSGSKIELQTKRKELAEIFFDFCKKLGEPKTKENTRGFSVVLISKNLRDKLIKIGFEDKNTLPTEKLNSEEKRISFLRGYFEGKSSASVRNRIIKVSGKKELLEQLKKLLEVENISAGIYKNGKYFSLYIEGKTKCLAFKNRIGFLSKEKNDKLDGIVSFSV